MGVMPLLDIASSIHNVRKQRTKLRIEGLMGGGVKGRKRHRVTDTQGHILHVKVHAANTHDTVAGCEVFHEAVEKYLSLQGLCADAGYGKTLEEFVQKVLKKTVEI